MTADKRRIDACLKACEGISTQNLEDNVPFLELARRYNALLRDNTALRAKIETIPYGAIEKILTEVMDIATANGANSVSMPDEYVEVAAWLCGVPGAQPAPSEGSITAGILSGMFLSLDGHDKAQPGYEWRKGWNDAIRQAMDYAQPAPSVPDDVRKDAERYRFLEHLCATGSYGGIISRKAIDAAMLAASPEAKP